MFSRHIIKSGVQTVTKYQEISFNMFREIRRVVSLRTYSILELTNYNKMPSIMKPSYATSVVLRQNSSETVREGDGTKKCKKEVDYNELRDLLEKDQVQLFDVREPKELEETGKIHPKAVNVPLTKLKACLKSAENFLQEFNTTCPSKQEDIVFYGYTDVKSVAALEIACKMGYKKARHYPGGWLEWSQKSK